MRGLLEGEKKAKAEGVQKFQRAAEVALGVSFNAQSQAPDIPGASSRAAFLRHTASLQVQSKVLDIYSLRDIRKSSLAPSTPKLKLPTTRPKFYWTFIYFRGARI